MNARPFALSRAAAALLAASTTACIFSEETTAPPKNPANSEPKYVLANLHYSFNHRAEETLHLCLADDFLFYFDAADVGRTAGKTYIIPTSWQRSDLERAAGNLFERSRTLSFSAAWETLGTPDPEVVYFIAEDVPVELIVTLEGNVVYRAPGSSDFEFAKRGRETWDLAKWRDGTGPGTEEIWSLGFLLASFYE